LTVRGSNRPFRALYRITWYSHEIPKETVVQNERFSTMTVALTFSDRRHGAVVETCRTGSWMRIDWLLSGGQTAPRSAAVRPIRVDRGKMPPPRHLNSLLLEDRPL